MNKFFVGAASLLAAASITACGSSSNGGSANNPGADAAKAAIAADIMSNNPSSGLSLSSSQANCIASGVVDGIGTQKLQSYGLLTSDNKVTDTNLTDAKLSTADATTTVNIMFGCASDTLQAALKSTIDGETGSLSTTQQACVDGMVTVDSLKPILIAQLSGQPDSTASLISKVQTCMTQ